MRYQTVNIRQATAIVILALATSLPLALPASALAAPEPTKWVLSSNIGWNVDQTKTEAGAPQEERNECTVASKDVCQRGEEGAGPRGFIFPESVAVSKLTGDVYIADKVNYRVQVLNTEGAFVLMFGWKVNKTTGGNVCTEAEIETTHVTCGAGEAGTGLAGQMFGGEALTVDAVTGNVYLLELEYHRVEEFTPTGEFVLMIGGEVNKKGGNVCTKAEENECRAGVEGTGHGAFKELERTEFGNTLTVGPQDELLYVGDEGRVQKFQADGKWVGQLPLSNAGSQVEGLAVDTNSDVFVVESAVPGVHEYNQNSELQSCVIDAGSKTIHGIALDVFQRLGVVDWTSKFHAALYESQGGECGKLVTGEIVPPSGEILSTPTGLAFSSNSGSKDQLYIAGAGRGAYEIEVYIPVLFPEVKSCSTTNITFTSALSCGEINPNGLEAKGFFKYGTNENALESVTLPAFTGTGITFEPFHFEMADLIPNQIYYDEAFAEAEIAGKRENTGGLPPVLFHTMTPPPDVPGEPQASVVRAQSAVLNGTLNPEHAATRYQFEYALCEREDEPISECTGPATTPTLTSSVYGQVTTIQEAVGLRPRTHYAFRILADNKFEYEGMPEGGNAMSQTEGHFTTGGLPSPQAVTGSASGVTSTTATIVGTVTPDGEPASYAFEMGVFNGAVTQFGVIVTGAAGASTDPTPEALQLANLQPATTYSYRIRVTSGYGDVAGQAQTFTTSGVPGVLSIPTVLAQLPVPSIKFPDEVKPRLQPRCKRGFQRDKHSKCVKMKRKARPHAKHKPRKR